NRVTPPSRRRSAVCSTELATVRATARVLPSSNLPWGSALRTAASRTWMCSSERFRRRRVRYASVAAPSATTASTPSTTMAASMAVIVWGRCQPWCGGTLSRRLRSLLSGDGSRSSAVWLGSLSPKMRSRRALRSASDSVIAPPSGAEPDGLEQLRVVRGRRRRRLGGGRAARGRLTGRRRGAGRDLGRADRDAGEVGAQSLVVADVVPDLLGLRLRPLHPVRVRRVRLVRDGDELDVVEADALQRSGDTGQGGQVLELRVHLQSLGRGAEEVVELRRVAHRAA